MPRGGFPPHRGETNVTKFRTHVRSFRCAIDRARATTLPERYVSPHCGCQCLSAQGL